MKKKMNVKDVFWVVALSLFLGFIWAHLFTLATVEGQPPVSLDDCRYLRQEIIDGELRFFCHEFDTTPNPTEPPPPTATTTASPVPNLTPTPIAGVDPYMDAPKCENHDARQFHELWNYADGCHYDHFHGDNPHVLDELFGTEIYDRFGGEISYPWQTENENQYKHGGYVWLVRQDVDCPSSPFGTDGSCVKNIRALAHGVGAAEGNVTAFHSYYVEMELCYQDECGIYRGGGWQGPASLVVDGEFVLRREDDGQRTFLSSFNLGNRCCSTWYNGNRAQVSGVIFEFGDMWTTVPPLDTAEEIVANAEWRCNVDENGDVIYEGCRHNSSRVQLHLAVFGIPQRYLSIVAPDENGIANWSGYTNRYGDFAGHTNRFGDDVPECDSIGLDCVPTEIDGVPIRTPSGAPILYQIRSDYTDYDIYFGGDPSGWIEYPINVP